MRTSRSVNTRWRLVDSLTHLRHATDNRSVRYERSRNGSNLSVNSSQVPELEAATLLEITPTNSVTAVDSESVREGLNVMDSSSATSTYEEESIHEIAAQTTMTNLNSAGQAPGLYVANGSEFTIEQSETEVFQSGENQVSAKVSASVSKYCKKLLYLLHPVCS